MGGAGSLYAAAGGEVGRHGRGAAASWRCAPAPARPRRPAAPSPALSVHTHLASRMEKRLASVAVSANCQYLRPKRRVSSWPHHTASSVGSMKVMPAAARAATACGGKHGGWAAGVHAWPLGMLPPPRKPAIARRSQDMLSTTSPVWTSPVPQAPVRTCRLYTVVQQGRPTLDVVGGACPAMAPVSPRQRSTYSWPSTHRKRAPLPSVTVMGKLPALRTCGVGSGVAQGSARGAGGRSGGGGGRAACCTRRSFGHTRRRAPNAGR